MSGNRLKNNGFVRVIVQTDTGLWYRQDIFIKMLAEKNGMVQRVGA